MQCLCQDSSAVQDQLDDVRQIQASTRAFAAIRGDGSVVAWTGVSGPYALDPNVWFARAIV